MWVVQNPPANAGDRDVGPIPGLGRSPGGGHGNPLQYSCLENPKDKRAWPATVHGIAKNQTWLSNWEPVQTENRHSVVSHVPVTESKPWRVTEQLNELPHCVKKKRMGTTFCWAPPKS